MSGHFDDDCDELVQCTACQHQHMESARPFRSMPSEPQFKASACPACSHDTYTDPAPALIQIGPTDV